MRLNQLLEALPDAVAEGGTEAVEVSGITDDSREAGPGVLFVAVKGEHTDGNNHVPEAVMRGAVAVISEKKVTERKIVGIQVPDVVDALASVSAHFFAYPSREMTLVGITGTNGKTTTSLLVQSILKESGRPAGLIGTLRYEIGEESCQAINTTPNSLRLQSLLHRMVEKRMKACVMEVSSHALALGRVRECRFDARVFTNLTRDHLDFHASMEEYYEVKAKLFQEGFAKSGGGSVVNADDPWGQRLIRKCSGPVTTFGLQEKADFRAVESENTIDGLVFQIRTPEGDMEIRSPLIGAYNIYNILSAVAVGFTLGISIEDIRKGIGKVAGIPGRFEKIAGPGFTVVVDYAHTVDALERLLQNARRLCDGKLITIFGCGGDRDRGKRPMMGKAAVELSDRVIVTSDNPRTEDPERITEEILAGIKEPGQVPVEVIQDRHLAIQTGMKEALEGDMVVVAGKGHENYQILGEKRIHFDDREEVRHALRQREK